MFPERRVLVKILLLIVYPWFSGAGGFACNYAAL